MWMLAIIFHLLVLLLLPPLLLGIINKTKAVFAGRNGPPVLQLYYDLLKLARKGMVISTTTTWVFQAGPLITLSAILLAGLMVPLGPFDAPIHFTGDLIFFAYLLGLARFFTTSAALDTGSPFEGMGASRDVTFAALSEPAVFLAFLMLAKLSGSLSLTGMLHAPANLHLGGLKIGAVVLVAAGLFIVLLAETSRIPVDDPNTHLELTMIHEVMVLDHSGPLLGIILYGAAMKLLVLSALLSHVLAPITTGHAAEDAVLAIAELLAVAVAIGVVESVMARLRMSHVPALLVAATLLCGFGFLLTLG